VGVGPEFKLQYCQKENKKQTNKKKKTRSGVWLKYLASESPSSIPITRTKKKKKKRKKKKKPGASGSHLQS
jgi:hypothetical protein